MAFSNSSLFNRKCDVAPDFPFIGITLETKANCSAGYYCPNVTLSTPASYCPPSLDCQLDRTAGIVCKPQGPYEPILCPPGFFCPTDKLIFPCPAGYFCPSGSIQPMECPYLADCSGRNFMFYPPAGIVACVVIDLFIFGIAILLKMRQIKLQGMSLWTMLPLMFRPNNVKLVKKVQPTASQRLLNGELDFVSLFTKAVEGEKLNMDFAFQNLRLKLSNGVEALQGVSGEILHGRMTAIMGPSGAGKTTFMNVLMGKVHRTGGSLKINGKEAEISTFKKLIGYVPQEDIMLRELTVRENIIHSARIRLPHHYTSKQIEDFVDQVICALQLEKTQHSPIGDESTRGISGGQRKRVNIGMELAGAPLAMFLDEPTSGLDATASLRIVNTLKPITELGIPIVSVIHQPRVEIFNAFDDVLLLVPGGLTAYLGPVKNVVPYFENLGYKFTPEYNPADELMDILSGKTNIHSKNKPLSPMELVEAWKKHISEHPSAATETDGGFHQKVVKMAASRGPNLLWNVYYCFIRSLTQQFRQVFSMIIEIIVGSFAGLLMGISLQQGNAELFSAFWIAPYTLMTPTPQEWVLALYAMLIGISTGLAAGPAAVNVFGNESPVYWREAAAGHSKLGYYIGKVFASFPRFIVSSLHFTAIYMYIGGIVIPLSTQYILILVQFYGVYGLGALIGFFVKKENASLASVSLSMIVAFCCGFAPTLTTVKKWGFLWLFEMSFNKWAAEAMWWEYIKNYAHVYDMVESAKVSGYTANRFEFNIGIAILIGSIYRILGYICLITVNRSKQV